MTIWRVSALPAHKALFVQVWRRFGNPSGGISWQVGYKLDFCPRLALWPGALQQPAQPYLVALSVILKVVLLAYVVAVTSL